MNMPGFTAEASLGQSGAPFQSAGANRGGSAAQGLPGQVVPADNLACATAGAAAVFACTPPRVVTNPGGCGIAVAGVGAACQGVSAFDLILGGPTFLPIVTRPLSAGQR